MYRKNFRLISFPIFILILSHLFLYFFPDPISWDLIPLVFAFSLVQLNPILDVAMNSVSLYLKLIWKYPDSTSLLIFNSFKFQKSTWKRTPCFLFLCPLLTTRVLVFCAEFSQLTLRSSQLSILVSPSSSLVCLLICIARPLYMAQVSLDLRSSCLSFPKARIIGMAQCALLSWRDCYLCLVCLKGNTKVFSVFVSLLFMLRNIPCVSGMLASVLPLNHMHSPILYYVDMKNKLTFGVMGY